MSEALAGPVGLRPAVEEDLKDLGAVERDAGRRFADVLPIIADDGSIPEHVLRSAIADKRVVVAVIGDATVGYAWWSVVDAEAHLEQVSIIGAVAGHGVGRRLIDWTQAEARRAGLLAMTLTTFRDIPWNGPLYERYGFVPLDEAQLPPELAARRASERDNGLDVAPRVAMRLLL